MLEVKYQFNWDYQECLDFQFQMQSQAKQNPEFACIIFTSHPHCFTYGRGLQRNSDQPLCDLSLEQKANLKLPLHQIGRGGGLTFHYPGQVIVYPILNFNYYKKNLARMMVTMLDLTGRTLQEMNLITNYQVLPKRLGLWTQSPLNQECKIASIGMNLERFVSMHGMALNFFSDSSFATHMANLNPCGISGQSYSHLQDLNQSRQLCDLDRKDFCHKFLYHFKNYLN